MFDWCRDYQKTLDYSAQSIQFYSREIFLELCKILKIDKLVNWMAKWL